ncbi:DUF2141 domain-containing protein [Halorubellus salinus]|uniref:DUF2141 domain-containing protein n=1 Tax=Halorubellus salinus TaxID=755309 RepID=UPI001D06F3A1|nr:DUF2141 domain-containing protein [Halorubellus salinus]
MQPSKRLLVAVVVVALAATAGCLADPIGDGTDGTTTVDTERTTTDGPATEQRESSHTGSTDGTSEPNDVRVWDADGSEAPDLAASLRDPVACDGGWVSYWGTGDAERLWRDDGTLRVGWTVPGNQSTLFVGFENATAVGVDHVEYENAVTADGAGVPAGDSDTGRYAVVMMHDVNGNGEYDPGTDRPCANDGDAGISWTGWLWVDWDADD